MRGHIIGSLSIAAFAGVLLGAVILFGLIVYGDAEIRCGKDGLRPAYLNEAMK